MAAPAGSSEAREAGKGLPGNLPEMTQEDTALPPLSVFGALLETANRRHPTADRRGMEGRPFQLCPASKEAYLRE